MTLALQGKPRSRQWLLVAFALLALIVGIVATLTARHVATADSCPDPFTQHCQLPIAYNDSAFIDSSSTCDVGPYDAGQEVWHFVIVQGDFVSLTATFAGGLTVDGVLGPQAGGKKHMYVLGPGGLDLIAVSTVTDPAGSQYQLSHICPGKKHSTTTTQLHQEPGDTSVGENLSWPLGSSFHDQATVTGDGVIAPTGTVDFVFYSALNCSGSGVDKGTVALDATGVAHPSNSTGALVAPGDYGFIATYSGDDVYAGSANSCERVHIRTSPSGLISVDKTVDTTFDRTCVWDVQKSASPQSQTLLVGVTGKIDWTVDVTADCTDTSHDANWVVSGKITIHNDATSPDTFPVADLSDSLSGAVVVCPDAFPFDIAPGDDVECTYSAAVNSGDDGTNIATVTVDSENIDSEGVDFSFDDPKLIDTCATVTDTMLSLNAHPCVDDTDDLNVAVDKGTWQYKGSSSVGAFAVTECGAHRYDNTANLVTDDTKTPDSDSATSTVNVPCVFGKTMGFWGNVNGQRLAGSSYTTKLGLLTCYINVTGTNDNQIFPNQLNGYPLVQGAAANCSLTSPKRNAFNTLLGQTLALDYNIHFVKTANGFQGDYSANTVASLQCTSYLTTALQAAPYSLSASSSVGDVLTAANKAVDARGGTVTGDFNSLLGCLNRES